MDIKNVTVVGSGVLGFQIAFQVAFHGYKVSVFSRREETLKKARAKFPVLSEAFKKDLNATQEQIDQTEKNLSYTNDLPEAVKDADLVIEAIPERIDVKVDFYNKISKLTPKHAIFVTNSSTLLPSQFAEATGRPSQFLALHFANNIWIRNTAEIMAHPGTDPKYFDIIVDFAKNIGMLPLPLKKEQPGYILNSLLVPLLNAASDLAVNDVAEPEIIDKTWMKATGAPMGPCAILDLVGITTAYNINKLIVEKTKDPNRQKVVDYYKENFIDKNKLGISTGEGFYKYPNPKYLDPDFLKK